MWVLNKIADYFIGALGGFLSGVVGSVFLRSLFFQLIGYQEGWYRQFAPLLFTVPTIALFVYVSWLAASKSNWRFVIAAILLIPIAALYLVTRFLFPVGEQYSWIEFTSFWVLMAQLAGILMVAAWLLYWTAYARMTSSARSS